MLIYQNSKVDLFFGDWSLILLRNCVCLIVYACRRNTRTITSLPVSPTASPLRQYGTAYRSCYASPPHPSYTMIGQGQSQSNYNLNEVMAVPSRPNTKATVDPWYQSPQVKPQTPTRSPRSRLIWSNSRLTRIQLMEGRDKSKKWSQWFNVNKNSG